MKSTTVGVFGALLVWSSSAVGQTPQSPSSPSTLAISGIWAAIQDSDGFKEIGQNGSRQFIMEVPNNSRHFELHLIGFDPSAALGASVPISIAFDNGVPFQFQTTNEFSGGGQPPMLYAPIPDQEMPAWTHALTAFHTMTVSFSGTALSPLVFDLTGTTPTVTAMAKGLQTAGVNDLPAPWTSTGSQTAAASEPSPSPPQMVSTPPAAPGAVQSSASAGRQWFMLDRQSVVCGPAAQISARGGLDISSPAELLQVENSNPDVQVDTKEYRDGAGNLLSVAVELTLSNGAQRAIPFFTSLDLCNDFIKRGEADGSLTPPSDLR